MSRPISFRGMDINGEWHYGLVAESAGFPRMPEKGVYISNMVGNPWAFQVRLETVGEYSGLQDKNGKKIYEGDRFRSHNSAGKSVGTVEYIEDGFKIVWDEPNYGCLNNILRVHATDGEVIGNIHEKELINHD